MLLWACQVVIFAFFAVFVVAVPSLRRLPTWAAFRSAGDLSLQDGVATIHDPLLGLDLAGITLCQPIAGVDGILRRRRPSWGRSTPRWQSRRRAGIVLSQDLGRFSKVAANPSAPHRELRMVSFWHAALGAALQFEAGRKHQAGVRMLFDSIIGENGQTRPRRFVGSPVLFRGLEKTFDTP
jgi:hypothetical protein